MSKIKLAILSLFAILCLLLAVSLFFNYKQYRDAKEFVPETITETIVIRDTVVTYIPTKPQRESAVGEKSYSVSVEDKHVPLPSDTAVAVGDTIVTFPIIQRVYEDSSYTAYVSGIDPMLDSIRIRSPTIEHWKVQTLTKTETKYKRFTVGVTAGYGYGFQCKQFEPFIGIGVTWNFLK